MSDQEPSSRRRRGGAASANQSSVAKGLILVAVAVIIGFVLINDSVQDSTGNIGADTAAQPDDTDTTVPDGASDTTAPTDTTTPAVRPPAEVKVLVANGTEVAGVAGTITTQLTQIGYQTGDATDAQQKPVDATTVYFDDGYQADAAGVADALGIPASNIAALPTTGLVENLQLSNIVVVVGPELAANA